MIKITKFGVWARQQANKQAIWEFFLLKMESQIEAAIEATNDEAIRQVSLFW